MKSSCMQWTAVLCLAVSGGAGAQSLDATRLHELVAGLTVTPRVLIVVAHPEDEDNRLIAWLSRGRHIGTGVPPGTGTGPLG